MKICQKCGKEYNDKESFCSTCGEKLITKEKEPIKEEKEVKKKHTLKYAIIGIVAVLLIAIVVVSTVPFPYEATQAYCETEPYTTTGQYQENEPYTTTEYVEYKIQGAYYEDKWSVSMGCYYVATVKVLNIDKDNKVGAFTVNFHMTTNKGAKYETSKTYYVATGDEYAFEATYNNACGETVWFTYDINPPTKEVTKYRSVTKSREVTKYHQVKKEKKITKYKTIIEQGKWYDDVNC